MVVKAKMDDGTLYKGIKCGSEGGLVYLVNPVVISEDDSRGDFPGEMESPIGEEISCGHEDVRILLLPLQKIKYIVSA